MNSRDKILSNLKGQIKPSVLGPVSVHTNHADPQSRFCETLISIGGRVLSFKSFEELTKFILNDYRPSELIYSAIPEVPFLYKGFAPRWEEAVLVVLRAQFGVAENGSVWLTDSEIPERVLPFITTNLLVVIDNKDIVPTMQEAYERIGSRSYDFGIFIAGPSKTADIEQSLVLGAHGPKSMTLALMG